MLEIALTDPDCNRMMSVNLLYFLSIYRISLSNQSEHQIQISLSEIQEQKFPKAVKDGEDGNELGLV